MCMQCVAQGAPFVGLAVTMLNRRNIKNWVADNWHGAHRYGPGPARDEPGSTAGVHAGAAAGLAPAAVTTRTSTAEVPTG
jgi:hypothetical protein